MATHKKAKFLVMAESNLVNDILMECMESFVSPDTPGLEVKAGRIADFSSKAEGMSVKKAVNYIKMFVLDDLRAPSVNALASWHIEGHAKVVTDEATSYVNFKVFFDIHEVYVESDGDVGVESIVKTKLSRVHIAANECRNGIVAIHKEVDRRYLQLYHNEYCWKFNRRYFRDSDDPKYDLFDRLMKIAALYTLEIKYDAGAAQAYDQSMRGDYSEV